MAELKEMDIGDEDGYVVVKIAGVAQTLDIVDVWDRYSAMLAEHGRLPDFAARLPPFLESLGFPTCSQRVAIRFINRMADVVAALKKNAADAGSLWPEPPASMDSQSGISLEESSSPSASA